MILVDSAGIRPPRPLKYYFKIGAAKIGKVMAAYGGKLGKKFRDYVYASVGSKDYASAGPMRNTFVRVVNEDQTNMLRDVQSPTLLIWGADDKETPLKLGEEMARLIPNSSLVVMENAGHFSFIDQPHKFNLIVRKFLRD
jgi:pimeloyl-ACP methyl ester carboxylesterase